MSSCTSASASSSRCGRARARSRSSWDVPVLANSALMFGYACPDWRDGYAGWEYLDTVADDNRVRIASARALAARGGRPIGCAAYDMGRLVGEAVARAEHLTRAGIADGLRRVKTLPAASGYDGTIMGFGTYDHAALKGHYLVLREWKDGRSVQVAPGIAVGSVSAPRCHGDGHEHTPSVLQLEALHVDRTAGGAVHRSSTAAAADDRSAPSAGWLPTSVPHRVARTGTPRAARQAERFLAPRPSWRGAFFGGLGRLRGLGASSRALAPSLGRSAASSSSTFSSSRRRLGASMSTLRPACSGGAPWRSTPWRATPRARPRGRAPWPAPRLSGSATISSPAALRSIRSSSCSRYSSWYFSGRTRPTRATRRAGAPSRARAR